MAEPARRLLTLDALDAIGEDRRVELIGGELVEEAMTSFEHGDAQLSVGAEIKLRFRGGGPDGKSGWWIATEVDVIYGVHEVYRHDVAGWRKSRVPRRPVGARVTERPDWVCEVLSTNRRKDLVEKRARLREAGVGHYWIIDPEARVLEVLRHTPDGYLVVLSAAPGMVRRLEPFEQIELDVSRLLGDLDEE